MEAQVIAKKIGGSIGVIIPKEIVERESIKPNSTLEISVHRLDDISDTFGALKRKMSGQEFKDRAREGWE